MQKQIDKYKDEVESLRIANETKEKRILELKEKMSNQETTVNKILESKALYEDSISEIKSRLDKAEEELSKASKDKIELQKENESLKKSVIHQRNEVNKLTKDLDTTHKKLKEYKNDRNANKEIKQLIDQIESSGDNYIRLMRSIKSCLDKTTDQSSSSIDIFLNDSN
ncbi:hypothetical protein BCR32DRAFT_244397 [Anaeromyces robustus]|uniref:Uncharacterized protein n=1 Tax=Anaeromyces robustus TaxID=1754192 RepID=A0A1Y1X8R2_9FUNG|nr:hypothetical protein BCR32DRAFT_244397 [Anaeromyces robustus]|eukprot:ORX82143.1 hypothetical protein BCR32DRAFT_244397 [Anaeromyces robustus]